MAEVTAAMVRELRDRTGVAMMDCKSALAEAGGDMDKAIDVLRTKGKAKQVKLAARESNEGRIDAAVSTDGKTGVVVEINCNTDFTAKSAPLVALGETCTQILLKGPAAAVADNEQVKAQITQAAQQTGENIQVGRTAVLAGEKIGAYEHYTGKIAVLVSLTGSPSDELIKDLCLHITAARPLALDRNSVPADIIAKEREIAVEQAKATGKPQAIAEKIAEGKMRTFFEERVLLDQKFVKDDSKTITQLLQSAGCTLVKYVRLEVGQ